MTIHERLLIVIEELCTEMGMYLIDLEVKGDKNNPMYQVFAETVKGITLGECESLSRAIQDEIDFNDDFPQKYRLDVSSPGLDKPLKEEFQFIRNIDKEIVFQKSDDFPKNNIIGKLKSIKDGMIVVQDKKGNDAEYSLCEIGDVKIKLQW